MLRIRLCGGVQVEARDAVVPDTLFGGRQGRLVLAYLARERHRPVGRDELAELLWGDNLPESWSTSLSAVVSRLRRLLGEAGVDGTTTLVSASSSYQLRLPQGSTVDLEEAAAAVVAAETAVEAGDTAEAVAHADLADAVTSRGFLPEDCEWVDRQREVVLDLAVRAAVVRAAAQVRAGSPRRGIDAARHAVELDPTSEAAYRQLMATLAASGERGEALRVWERCRTALVEELGVDPSPATEAVYLEILGDTDIRPTSKPAPLPSGVVTFLLTDIVDSSMLWDQHPTAMAVALERHDQLIAELVAANDGTLLKSKLEGDATVSVFARATAAVGAALALLDAIADEAWPTPAAPQLRMAMHTGEAFERGGDYFGPALNRAARLRALAEPGRIVVSQAVAELVADHLPAGTGLVDRGNQELRGISRSEHVYELSRGTGRAPSQASGPGPDDRPLRLPSLPAALTGTGPFVGRGDELARLRARWERAAEGVGGAVLIGGEPGVGKSRLAGELAATAHAHGALVVHGRCDEDLAAPLQPFVEALRVLGPVLGAERLRAVRGIDELARVVPELAELVGAHDSAARADPDSERLAVFDAVTQVLRVGAAAAPLLLVLDDLHWAGKTTLSLLRHVLRGVSGARLLVAGTYRDTELGRSHPLASMLADLRREGGTERVRLAGLEPADVVAYLSAVGNADRALGRELAEVTAGNPFFLIEALRHVEESGGRWEPGSLPEGVREATGRRLSRLSGTANDALAVAAVAGARFDLTLVEQVRGTELVDEIAEACDAGLVIEEAGAPGVFRFAHALVRQVLLAELVTLKRVRLHRAIAELLEAAPIPADPDARLADLAYHWYECASAGGADRAVDACRRAADRAFERLAYEEAGDLYAMAIQASENLDAPDPDQAAALHLARCDALLTAGDVTGARQAIDALERAAHGSERLAAWYTTYEGLLAVLAEPDRLTEIVRSIGAAAGAMRAAGDLRGEAKAHYVHASALERLGQIGAAERALDAALAAARAADDRRLADAILAEAPPAALWGPRPVTRASGSCLDVVRVLRITNGAPAVEAVALRCQAVLEALRGRMDAARRMIGSAQRTVERLGLAHRRLETQVAAGYIELLDGEAAAAEALLSEAYDELRDRGLDGEAAQAAAFLGRALLLQDRFDEADAVATEAAALAGSDLKAGIAWRDVRAEAAARRGEIDRALALAREAVGLATATDALLLVADARFTLATVLRAAGDRTGVDAETQRAIEACEAKGATAMLAKVRGAAPAHGQQSASRSPSADPSVAAAPAGGGGRLAMAWANRFHDAANRRDFDAIVAGQTPLFRVDDRRPIVGRVPEVVAVDRFAFSGDARLAAPRLLDARGERVALTSWALAGDGYEVAYLAVVRVDAHGRIADYVMFDEDELGAATACLLEGAARAAEQRFDNDAVANQRRTTAGYNEHDWELVSTRIADDMVVEDRRSLVATTLDREGLLRNNRLILDGGGRFEFDVLATRGRSCALSRWRLHIAEQLSDAEVLIVLRVDDAGNDVRSILLDDDDLDAAMAELDRQHAIAEPDGAHAVTAEPGVTVVHLTALSQRAGVRVLRDDATGEEWVELFNHDGNQVLDAERFTVDRFDDALVRFQEGTSPAENDAVRSIRRMQAAYNERDWDAVLDCIAPGWVQDDRRSVMWATPLDRDELMRGVRHIFDGGGRFERETVATRGQRLALTRWTLTLPDEQAVVPILAVTLVDDDGRYEHTTLFDADAVDDALAELDRRHAALATADPPFGNEAWRAVCRLYRAADEHDPERFWQGLAPDWAYFDKRGGAQLHLTGEDALATFRVMFELDSFTTHLELLATRDEHLAICRLVISFVTGAAGPAEVETLNVVECDGEGRISLLSSEADLRAAYDELDARFVAHGGPDVRVYRDAFQDRAWDRYRTFFDPGCTVDDRRVTGYGRLDRDGFVAAQQEMVALAPDTELWLDHVRAGDGTTLTVTRYAGTRDGGRFERPAVVVSSYDASRRTTAVRLYDLDEVAEAITDFEDRQRPTPAERFANTAWRAARTVGDAFNRRDIEAVAAALGPGFEYVDRRTAGASNNLPARRSDAYVALFELDEFSYQRELVATRGEQLVLVRDRVSFVDGVAGLAEVVTLTIVEVDADGAIVRNTAFDVDAPSEAFDELDARYVALGGPDLRAYRHALAARDWERFRSFFAPSFTLVDQRRLGIGRVDLEGLVRHLRGLAELAPDTRQWTDHVVASSAAATLLFSRTTGTNDEGGEIGWSLLTLAEVDGDGRIASLCYYDPEDIDRALADFEAATAPAPTERFANAAWRAVVRLVDAHDRRDRAAAHALFRPDFEYRDRRTTAPLPHGGVVEAVDALLSLDQYSYEHSLLATRGDTLALARSLVTFVDGQAGPAEIPCLTLWQVDASGRFTSNVGFDVDALTDAYEELDARYVALGGPDLRPYRHAQAARDWDRFATFFAPGFAFTDDRPLRWGRQDLAGFLELMRMFDDVPDAQFWMDHVVAHADAASLTVGRTWGTNLDGGLSEWTVASLAELDGHGRITRLRFYDLEELDKALAGFDRLTVPFANTAWRTTVALQDAANTRDEGAFRALLADGYVDDDRRHGVGLVTTGAEAASGYREMFALDHCVQERTLLATRGDRLTLVRTFVRFAVEPGGPSEVECLTLIEVDDTGRVTHEVSFDAADLDAAHAELDARYPEGAAAARSRDAFHRRDWEAWAAEFDPACAIVDHRTGPWGRLDRRQFVDYQRQLVDLAPDARMWLDHLIVRDGVQLNQVRTAGTMEGGPWERPVIAVARLVDGRTSTIDVYETEDHGAAHARFEELRGIACQPAPNRAWRTVQAIQEAFERRDWDAFVEGHLPTYVYDDRRPAMRHRLEGQAALESHRTMFVMDEAAVDRRLLATVGDRVALTGNRFRGSDGEVGTVEIELVAVEEIGEDGRSAGATLFAADDVVTAEAYLHERAAALAPRPNRVSAVLAEQDEAFARRDWPAFIAAYSEGYLHDDRRAGQRITFTHEESVASLRFLFDLEDATYDRQLLATRGERLALVEDRVRAKSGAVDRFEIETLTVVELDDDGLARHTVFAVDDLRKAIAELERRHEALGP